MSGLFVLNRACDESGVSGVGVVAWGVQFPDGVCVLRWRSEHKSTAVYASISDLKAIHGHDGATAIEWPTAEEWERHAHGPQVGRRGKPERERIRRLFRGAS